MGDRSAIEWTDASWNMIRAVHLASKRIGWICVRVSAGCTNCYAASMNGWRGNGEDYTVPGLGRVEPFLDEKALMLPLRWRSPRRVFVCSMTDLFGEWVPDEWIDRVFAVMALCPQHQFQVLTKRPERMRAYMERLARLRNPHGWSEEKLAAWAAHEDYSGVTAGFLYRRPWPLPHVQLGTSVEDQPTADERTSHLIQTPAAVRWVSYEPALGPVDFCDPRRCSEYFSNTTGAIGYVSAAGLTGANQHPGRCTCQGNDPTPHKHYPDAPYHCARCLRCQGFMPINPMAGLDWIVVGGESGPGARPCDVAWIRSVIAQCRAAGVPAFVKQLGSRPVCRFSIRGDQWIEDPEGDQEGDYLGLTDRKGGDPAEWPEDLRVREFPQ